ncbi:transposase, partial [Cylindrospermopsis raciborskii CS-506_B]
VHAFALAADEVHLVVTPADAHGPSRLMQAVGRRYVSAHHRRHGGAGTLWDGRFRCAIVEPGAALLSVLTLVDGVAAEPGHSSAGQR